MFYLYFALLTTEDAFQMHQAAHIRGRDIFRSMMKMIGDPVLTHFYRYRLFRHAESTAESTAFILPVKLDQLDAFHQLQQLSGLEKGGAISSLICASFKPRCP
jgi:hypothetical protein